MLSIDQKLNSLPSPDIQNQYLTSKIPGLTAKNTEN